MSTRSKRMIKYLEETLGWNVTTRRSICTKNEFHFGQSGKFCSECGAKTKTINDVESVKQIEEAIKYSLKEKA